VHGTLAVVVTVAMAAMVITIMAAVVTAMHDAALPRQGNATVV